MTYYRVQSPYPIFTDEDGTPLENGYIYIGEENLNPITSPITVYWDDASLYPASQPIRTIAGHASRDGTPANIYINGTLNDEYSILILDKNGEQVHYSQQGKKNYIATDTAENLTDLRGITFFDTSIFLRGHTTAGDGGHDHFEWNNGAGAGTYVDDNGSIIVPTGGDGSGAWERSTKNDEVAAEAFGIFAGGTAANNSAGIANFISSSIGTIVFRAGQTYEFNAKITLASNKTLRSDPANPAILDFPGVLGVAAGESQLIGGASLSEVMLSGLDVRGDVTEFTDNGFNTYGIYFEASDLIKISDVIVRDVENGVSVRDGCTNCTIERITAIDCFYHSVSSWATSADPNRRITFRNIHSYGTSILQRLAPVSGLFFEETYDSSAMDIIAHDTIVGVRVENSCDNTLTNIRSYENFGVGFNLYNSAQRNTVSNVVTYNNNRGNHDAVDSTTRGNDNTLCSGVNIENNSNNNSLSNINSFQTESTIIPFNSGSDEPVLGSLIGGVTSTQTARVRRIEVTSGTWGGGNAAGNFYCVEPTGAFNAAETIQNLTTIVPYTSGSSKPRPGDTIEGATSGASGTLLWASQQSAADWAAGTSSGNLYLINVSGNYNGAENLNNTTTSENNFATNTGAETPVDTDIATTNGATTLNEDAKGFQKYGIAINIRNLTGIGTADCYNNISNFQCPNNDLSSVSDRGFYSTFNGSNSYYYNLIRN